MAEIKYQVKRSLSITLSIFAIIALLLALLILFMGEDILQRLALIYPSWAFPAFFIPWFLLMISSVQKLNKHKQYLGLQVWFLKITAPIILFVVPYFSQFLNSAKPLALCMTDCQDHEEALFGFEPYCMIAAMLSLFILFSLPSKYLHNRPVSLESSLPNTNADNNTKYNKK